MNQLPPIINLENRACHGCRLEPLNSVPHPHRKSEITFQIIRDTVKDDFLIKVNSSYLEWFEYKQTKGWLREYHPTEYQHCNSINECLTFVYKKYGIVLNIINEPVIISYQDKEMESWKLI